MLSPYVLRHPKPFTRRSPYFFARSPSLTLCSPHSNQTKENMETLLTLAALAIPVALLVGIHLEDYYRSRATAKAEAAAAARREAILTAAIEKAMLNAARRRQAELQAAARRKAAEDFITDYYSPRANRQ